MTIPSDLESISNTKAAIKQAIINKGVSVSSSDDFATYPSKIASISGGTLTTKTITANGTYAASSDNADGYSSVSVNVAGTQPSGTYTITANGTYDVTNYASADVNVSGGGGSSVVPLTDMVFEGGIYRLFYDEGGYNLEFTTSSISVGFFPFLLIAGYDKEDTFNFLSDVFNAFDNASMEYPWQSEFNLFPVVANDFSEAYLFDYESYVEGTTLTRV